MQVKGEIIRVRNAKRIILVLLAFVLTMFFAVSLVNVFEFSKSEKISTEAAWNLNGLTYEDDGEPYFGSNWSQYKNNSTFTITDLNGWKAFIALVDWDIVDFSGKTVELHTDLDLQWGSYDVGFIYNQSDARYFRGVFNGKGHTLSNVTIPTQTKYSGGGARHEYTYSGLFYNTQDATIKNLQLYNCTTTINLTDTLYEDYVYVGAIMGDYIIDKSTISHCSVRNYIVNINGKASAYNNVYVGGIIGSVAETIDNCIVANFTVNNNVGLGSNKLTTAGVSGWDNSSTSHNISKCVVTSTTNSGISYNITKGKATGTNYTTANGTYSSLDLTSTWYYNKDFNDGYPMLRQFISWQWVNCSVNDASMGSIGQTAISIPSITIIINGNTYNYSMLKEPEIYDITDQTLNIYHNSVGVQANSGYKFVKYTLQCEVTRFGELYMFESWELKAWFERDTHTLTFANATGVASGDTVDPNESIKTYQVAHNTTVTASHTSGNGPIILKYTFKNSSGTDCEVTYTITEKYRLTSTGIDGAITEDTTISPTVEVRTFSVTLAAASGSNQTSNTVWTEVPYGTAITYSSANISFALDADTSVTYTPEEGYELTSVTIIKNGTTAVDLSESISVTGNLYVRPRFDLKLFTLTFANPVDPEGNEITDEDITISVYGPNDTEAPIKVEHGRVITISHGNGGTGPLSFIYNFTDADGYNTTVTYYIPAKYNLINQNNPGTVTGDTEIRPTITIRTFSVTFANATGVVSGDSAISPSVTTAYTVIYGTTITASPTSGNGPITLTYTFNDSSGTAQNVTYTIPEKYSLTNTNNSSPITANKTISPTVEVRTFSVTFKTATGSTLTGADKPWTVVYGSAITYDSSKIKFTQGSNTATYTPDTGHQLRALNIIKDGAVANVSALASITGNIVIQPVFELKTYTVTFNDATCTSNDTACTNGYKISPTRAQITVSHGMTISVNLSTDKKKLTYSYEETTVTYTATNHHILQDESNRTSITISTDGVEITPIATFYACTVTMRNDSTDTKVNQAMATMSGYSSAFIVEFGTILAATHSTDSSGNEVYTYSFTYNGSTVKTVTYTTNATKYEIDSYGIDGAATSHTFAAGTTSKTISPTFKVKQYTLTIKVEKDGAETSGDCRIYHDDTLTYSANLSLSDDSKFTYATASLYGALSSTELKHTGYFVESYTITYGTTTSVVSADGTETTDTNVTVTSGITIEIEFKTFYTVTFTTGQTGVDRAEAQNSYTNPMNLKSGSRIQATYSGYPSRDLTYSVTYTDASSVTEQVFKYTLSQYYRVTDTKDIDNLQATTPISPTIEFYACEVTIWKDDANNIATLKVDGVEKTSSYIFIVEYGTEVEFATPTQSEGKFTYTYIFTYAGEEIATITYTITDDEYAMSSELTTEGRVWHSDLGENDKAEEYEFESTAGTTYLISPTFELKEYGGNVA